MVQWYNSLMTKLTASFIVLILVISGLTFFYTYGETKTALRESTRDQLMSVAGAIADGIDGDLFSQITPGDENSAEYQAIHAYLNEVRSNNPAIKYVYTMRNGPKGVSFVVDADYGISEDAAVVGDTYEAPNGELIAGFAALSADEEFTTDQWGTVLSGYAPVRDRTGTIVGLVGVDMDVSKVQAKENFIGATIYYIVGIAILVAGLFIALFSRTIIRDIKALNVIAEDISMGNLDGHVTVKRSDEIGELADSFSRLVVSVKYYVSKLKENSG